MEQLSHSAVGQLLAKARNGNLPGQAPAPANPRPWINPALERPAATAPTCPEPPCMERRLVRRAEALWARLAGDEAMPAADRADEFLRQPFSAQALRMEIPAGASAILASIGDSLAHLTSLVPGPADEAAATRAGARLLALARRAATLGEPCLYDSDDHLAEGRAEAIHSQLLMRAIALPFSGVRGDPPGAAAPGVSTPGATAIVIASWRKLLSVEETQALHRELAAAIDWMHRQGT